MTNYCAFWIVHFKLLQDSLILLIVPFNTFLASLRNFQIYFQGLLYYLILILILTKIIFHLIAAIFQY